MAVEVDCYKVRWWGSPGAPFSRPDLSVFEIRNPLVRVRIGLVEGRPLDDYTLPYWPIRSFVSVVNTPAELAQAVTASWTQGGEASQTPLVPGRRENSHRLDPSSRYPVLWIHSRAGREVVARLDNSPNDQPLFLELFLRVLRDSPTVQMSLRGTNRSDSVLKAVSISASFHGRFNWGRFAACGTEYRSLDRICSGSARGFFAFSEGMGRGYELHCSEPLRYRGEMAAWTVKAGSIPSTLRPGEGVSLTYTLRPSNHPTPRAPEAVELGGEWTRNLTFSPLRPSKYRSPPTGGTQVPHGEALKDLGSEKIRGLNLRDPPEDVIPNIRTARDWGCNLVILDPGIGDQISPATREAHRLGMKLYVSGGGGYTADPSFDHIGRLEDGDAPDSFGQDEDHYYWYGIQQTRNFQAEFGKPADRATQEERARFWGLCFADKWRRILRRARSYRENPGVWFYTPCPSIANFDPLDFYDEFLREVARLGERLTVFPFYYGVDPRQAGYMIRRWRRAGARRVALLLMRGFLSRPSQYFELTEAARRAGADGVCGFNFFIEDDASRDWEWRSLLLSAQASFPTEEMDAYVVCEEPARLLRLLADSEIPDMLSPSDASLDSEEDESREAAGFVDDATYVVETGRPQDPTVLSLLRRSRSGRGVVSLRGGKIRISALEPTGLRRAGLLLRRLCHLARIERDLSE